jgi:hypothetical protein
MGDPSSFAYPQRFARNRGHAYNEDALSPLAMMSTAPKYNVRTNRQKDPWEFTGDRATQGEVTVNVLVNNELIRARQDAAKTARTKGTRTMGTLVNPDNIQIREKDLVFVPRMMRTNNGTLYGSVKDPLAISSFTGINTNSELFGNQDQFEASFYLVGKSKIPYNFGSPEQSKSGISVMTSGATTVHNNGVETFAFGDPVAWYTYNVNDEKREHQIMSVRKARGEPQEKFGALLKRLGIRDIYKLTQNAIERYIVASNDGRRDEFLTAHYKDNLPSKREFDALRRHFRAECVQSTAVDSWLTLVTFFQLGLINFTMPEDPSGAAYAPIVNKFKDIELTAVNEAGGYNVDAQGAATEGSDAKRTSTWKHAQNLAHLFNILPNSPQPLSPLTGVLDILIKRKYRGLLEGNHSYKHRSSASILRAGPKDLLDAENQMPRDGSVAQYLDHVQLNTARDADNEFYTAYRRATEQIFAISISSTSEPGYDLDVVM